MYLDDGRCVQTMTSKQSAKSYRVIAISMYDDEVAAADRVTDILRRGGWPKANRSLVMREALIRLEEELAGLSAEELFQYFASRQAKRAAAPATVHESRHAAYGNPADTDK
jgi:hypothetical protein